MERQTKKIKKFQIKPLKPEQPKTMTNAIGYVITPQNEKFRLLLTFLQKNQNKKTIVIMSTRQMIEFYNPLLNEFDIKSMKMNLNPSGNEIIEYFSHFVKNDKSALLVTCEVLSEVDFNSVDYMIYYDIPSDIETLKNQLMKNSDNKSIQYLSILIESEKGFVDSLSGYGHVKKFDFPINQLLNIDYKLKKLTAENYYYARDSRKAFESFIQWYHCHNISDVFNLKNINQILYCANFGLTSIPRIILKDRIVDHSHVHSKTPILKVHKKFLKHRLVDRLKEKLLRTENNK